MILRSKHFIFPFLALTAITSIYIAGSLTIETSAIALGIISLTYLVFIASSVIKGAGTRLKHSDAVLYKSIALHDVDDNPVKGTLYLLQDKLVFQYSKSRSFPEVVIPLGDVNDISFSKTYNSLDRKLIIAIKNRTEQFLVKGNLLWIDEIENALAKFSLSCS